MGVCVTLSKTTAFFVCHETGHNFLVTIYNLFNVIVSVLEKCNDSWPTSRFAKRRLPLQLLIALGFLRFPNTFGVKKNNSIGTEECYNPRPTNPRTSRLDNRKRAGKNLSNSISCSFLVGWVDVALCRSMVSVWLLDAFPSNSCRAKVGISQTFYFFYFYRHHYSPAPYIRTYVRGFTLSDLRFYHA